MIARINSGPRPLALYPLSHDNARTERLLTQQRSGGVSINDALFHVGQHDLPFGGIGDSGATPQSNHSTASNGSGDYITLPDGGVDADNARGRPSRLTIGEWK